MKRIGLAITLLSVMVLPAWIGCDEGINDWNSSAKISGYVLESVGDPTPITGVQVIIEADEESEDPYQGPDRWFVTDENGYFEGYIFLGNNQESDSTEYEYVADLTVSYFLDGSSFGWNGGVTVAPGSHFTLPTVYRNMFTPFSGGSGQ